MSLAPELGLVAFSPLAQLADAATFDDSAPTAAAARRLRRQPAPRASSISSARRGPVSGAPPSTGSPAPEGLTPGSRSSHETVARMAAGPTAPAAAVPVALGTRSVDADAPASSSTPHVPGSGATPVSGSRAPQLFEQLESVVREAEASLQSSPGLPAAPVRSQSATSSTEMPAASSAPAKPTRSPPAGVPPAETAPLPHEAGSPFAASAAPEGGVQPASTSGLRAPVGLDQLRRTLLSTPLITGTPRQPATAAGGSTGPPAPAASSSPAASARGIADLAAGMAAADPADVAWFVNEALIEQARRHGVDLT